MNSLSENDQSSVVEYSLSELGFILVFVLLLFSGWELHNYNENIEEASEKLSEKKQEIRIYEQIVERIADAYPEASDLYSDLVLIEQAILKKERLLSQIDELMQENSMLKEKLKPLSTPPDSVNMAAEFAESEQEKLEPKAVSVEEEEIDELLLELEETSNNVPSDQLNLTESGKIGEKGFCTYEPSSAGDQEHGQSVALGTVIIHEDGITLLHWNTELEEKMLVDIAGRAYDISQAIETIKLWPMNQMMSGEEFLRRGARLIDIGNQPSEFRRECRFGMDYHKVTYSKKADDMFRLVFQAVFFPHNNLYEEDLKRRGYELPKKQNPTKPDEVDLTLRSSSAEFIEPVDGIGKDIAKQNLRSVDANDFAQTEGIIEAAKLIKKSSPDYPGKAYRAGIGGYAKLLFSVNDKGRPIDITVLEETPKGYGFAEEAERALKRWRYKPSTENGMPVRQDGLQQPFSFKLK